MRDRNINPRPDYRSMICEQVKLQHAEDRPWVYIDQPIHPDAFARGNTNYLCACQTTLDATLDPKNTLAETRMIVFTRLSAAGIMLNRQRGFRVRIGILAGQCPVCHRVYWRLSAMEKLPPYRRAEYA